MMVQYVGTLLFISVFVCILFLQHFIINVQHICIENIFIYFQRAKKLKEVEHELLETQAQESELSRRKHLTEVTKTVFHIYFRLLKTAPRSKLLAAALGGLAKLVLTQHRY